MSSTLASLTVAPLLPWWAMALIAVLAGAALWRYRGLSRWRMVSAALALAVLLGPRLTVETRLAVPDVAVVLVDQSRSQTIGHRQDRTQQAVEALQKQLAALPNLEVRLVPFGADAPLSQGTELFRTLSQVLADIPKSRLAGIVALTDGVVHDQPAAPLDAPFHVLLTGDKGETDRRIQMVNAPDFALVGKEARLTFRVLGEEAELPVRIEIDGQEFLDQPMPQGKDVTVDIPIRHAGKTVIDVAVAAGPHELTLENNHAIVGVSGIRDRLKVLLLSGAPHVGERVWRNLLKADPAVDLVHFTILRSPDKADPTPLDELALISFPVRELFEQRLPDFDLVILDRFKGQELPASYLPVLASYVQNGGALLVAAGPELVGPYGLAQSPLADILPALPSGPMVEAPVKPSLTADGLRHPVTALFAQQQHDWGRWLRVIPTHVTTGSSLLQTPDGSPLLVLSHAGDGRVAELLSDTGWLWARGWENGGPYRELLRRTVHWLMKEPELEEESLTARIDEDRLLATRQSLSATAPVLTITAPDGGIQTVPLEDHGDGTQTASAPVAQSGLWRVSDGRATAIAIDGDPSPLEMSDLVATDQRLKPVATATKGNVWWLAQDGVPAIRRTTPGGAQSGSDWMGLVQRGDSVVTGLSQSTLWPSLILILAALACQITAWLREGR